MHAEIYSEPPFKKTMKHFSIIIKWKTLKNKTKTIFCLLLNETRRKNQNKTNH